MKVEQISIFLENRAGQLSLLLDALARAHINILALSLADTSDFGILRLIVNNQEQAKEVIRQNGFTVGSTTVIAVELRDRPGALADVLAIVSANGINVEYMYACACPHTDKVIMIFRFDKIDEAIPLLETHKFTLLSENKLICQ